MNRILKYFLFLLIFLLISYIPPYYVYSAVKHSETKETYCAYAHFLTAELERFKGNTERVIQEYEKAIECDPSSFYLRKGLIILLLSQNKVDPAKTLIEETLKLFPDRNDLALILSQLYKNEGKNTKAIRTLDKIIKKDPENQNANFLLFTLLLDDKKWNKAEEYVNRFMELAEKEKTKKLEDIYLVIGVEYAKVGNFTEGLEYLEKARDISPDNPQIRVALGTLYEGMGKFEEALKEYEKALSLSPFSLMLYYRLGEIYSQLNRIDDAISIYEKALQINSNDYVSSTNLAQLYYRKGEYQKGLKILEDCPIKDSRVYYLLGTFLVKLEKMDEGRGKLEKVYSAHSQFVYSLFSSHSHIW